MTTIDKPLAGLLALVTGASRGIGRACAIGLAEAGAHVIATARTQGGLEELDDEILKRTGERATLVPLDLKDGDGIDRLGGAIYDRWKKELKPQGFGLSARIVSYDDGIIGDIGL